MAKLSSLGAADSCPEEVEVGPGAAGCCPEGVEVGSAGENSSWHLSSRANSSPNSLVTDTGTQEKPSGSVEVVVVLVAREVTVRVIVSVSVNVLKASQDSCLGWSCGVRVPDVSLGRFGAAASALAFSEGSGGVNESAHSVSNSSVQPSPFVTVKGGQLKPGGSSGSVTSVIVLVVVEVYV